MQTLSIFGGFMLFAIGCFFCGEVCAKASKKVEQAIIAGDFDEIKSQKAVNILNVLCQGFHGFGFIALIASFTTASVRLIFF